MHAWGIFEIKLYTSYCLSLSNHIQCNEERNFDFPLSRPFLVGEFMQEFPNVTSLSVLTSCGWGKQNLLFSVMEKAMFCTLLLLRYCDTVGWRTAKVAQ